MPGPSKEELENYWKNSRQYFDELAKYYLESDREYYDKNIAPFYNNPFRRSGTQGSGSGGSGLILAIAMFLVIGAGAAVFLLVSTNSDNDDKKNVNEETQKSSQKRADATDSVGLIETEEYYEKGVSYFDNEDYENAEKYLKQVPRKDKNYPDAVRKLKFIAEKRIEKETKDERRVRSKPLQRIN